MGKSKGMKRRERRKEKEKERESELLQYSGRRKTRAEE